MKNPWSYGWSDGHAPPKEMSVAEWSAEEVYLANSPLGAKYQPGGHSDAVLNDLKNPDVYEIGVVGHTGMGKSATLECALCYVIAEAPGPTLVLGQTDDTIKEWMETRANKAFEKCGPVARLLPSGKDRHDKRKTSILFRHMELLTGGANLTNTQEKSMRYVFGDEPWAWKHGILNEALKRHHDRWNRKSLFTAQGGTEDDDWHGFTRNGHGHDRAFRCPCCNAPQVYKWSQVKFEKLRDANDEWDWPQIFEGVHYECENRDCAEKFEDSARGRRRHAEHAYYKPRNNSHIPGRVIYYVPAMANPRIQLSTLVKEWLLAEDAWKNGDKTPRRQFIQKRLAQFWVEKSEAPTLTTGGEAYQKSAYNEGEKWEGEHDRHMRIDVQKGHFWASIRAWQIGDGVKSRLLWEGKVDTWQTLFHLQERFGIENNRVFIDGRYEIDTVVREVTKHCGPNLADQWILLIGQDSKGYQFDVGTPKKPRKVWRMYSKFQYGSTHTGQRFRTIHFSNLRAKDALLSIMELPEGQFGIPVDVSKNYVSQMQSEHKREYAPGQWRWEKIKDHFHNHLWDTEMMGIVACSILGILKIETVES